MFVVFLTPLKGFLFTSFIDAIKTMMNTSGRKSSASYVRKGSGAFHDQHAPPQQARLRRPSGPSQYCQPVEVPCDRSHNGGFPSPLGMTTPIRGSENGVSQTPPRPRTPLGPNAACARGGSPVPGARDTPPLGAKDEHIHVCVRMRPPPTEAEGWCLANSNKVQRATKGREIYRNDGTAAWKWDSNSITFSPAKADFGLNRAAQQYPFSHLWGMHVQTRQVYQEVGQPIVRRVFEGYNGCIMAYGQTNSGYALV